MRQALTITHTATLLLAVLCSTSASALTHGDGRDIQTCHQLEPSSALVEAEAAPPGCHWSGTAPFCNGICQGPKYAPRKVDKCGDGSCCWTGKKVLCCLKKRRPTRPSPPQQPIPPPPRKGPHHLYGDLDREESGLDEDENTQESGWSLVEKLVLGI